MATKVPLVSVGVPVFNGARHLRGALESLLRQDYPNLEIVISDNCSQDDTANICREYADRDPRIRYTRTKDNIGAIKNFNRVFELSSGEFFAWAAHDDLWDPSYFSRCAERLISRPDVVLAHSRARYIDEHGEAFENAPNNPLGDTTTVRERFHAVMLDPWWGLAVYGLIRSSAMRETGLIRDTMGGDKVFLAELIFHGCVVEVPEQLWSYRMKPFDRSYIASLKRALFVKKRLSAELFPYANLCKEYLRVSLAASVPASVRGLIVADILYWYLINATAWPFAQRVSRRALGPRYELVRQRLLSRSWFRRLRHIPESSGDPQ